MKKSKLFLTLVLALALCLSGFAVTAFAADHAQGTPGSPAQAVITKHLQLPKGATIPTANFTFDVVPESVDGNKGGDMPTIGTITVGYAPGMTPTVPTTTDSGNVTHIYKESGNILAGVTGPNAWPHAGVYVYKITETEDTYTIAAADAAHEIMKYSQAAYTLTVYVKETALGSGVYYADSIYVVRDTKDDGTAEVPNTKVNPEPGGGSGTYSGLVFTNSYVHTNGTDTPDTPDPLQPAQAALTITKEVRGAYSSTSVDFDYTLTIIEPAFTDAPDPELPGSYKAYRINAKGDAVVGSPITFVSGTPNTFKLRHGERLVFVNTPVGTEYAITEAGTFGYDAVVSVTCAGGAGGTASSPDTGKAVEIENRFVGEGSGVQNLAAFVNTRADVIPTGLNLNDLPYIAMIVLALGAVAAFVVVKVRRWKLHNH